MDVPTALLDERWPQFAAIERYEPPPTRQHAAAINRWGDTADDQRRRRKALVEAMREGNRAA